MFRAYTKNGITSTILYFIKSGIGLVLIILDITHTPTRVTFTLYSLLFSTLSTNYNILWFNNIFLINGYSHTILPINHNPYTAISTTEFYNIHTNDYTTPFVSIYSLYILSPVTIFTKHHVLSSYNLGYSLTLIYYIKYGNTPFYTHISIKV